MNYLPSSSPLTICMNHLTCSFQTSAMFYDISPLICSHLYLNLQNQIQKLANKAAHHILNNCLQLTWQHIIKHQQYLKIFRCGSFSAYLIFGAVASLFAKFPKKSLFSAVVRNALSSLCPHPSLAETLQERLEKYLPLKTKNKKTKKFGRNSSVMTRKSTRCL